VPKLLRTPIATSRLSQETNTERTESLATANIQSTPQQQVDLTDSPDIPSPLGHVTLSYYADENEANMTPGRRALRKNSEISDSSTSNVENTRASISPSSLALQSGVKRQEALASYIKTTPPKSHVAASKATTLDEQHHVLREDSMPSPLTKPEARTIAHDNISDCKENIYQMVQQSPLKSNYARESYARKLLAENSPLRSNIKQSFEPRIDSYQPNRNDSPAKMVTKSLLERFENMRLLGPQTTRRSPELLATPLKKDHTAFSFEDSPLITQVVETIPNRTNKVYQAPATRLNFASGTPLSNAKPSSGPGETVERLRRSARLGTL